jgi:NitT/TauT family transport system substrate-binding protein
MQWLNAHHIHSPVTRHALVVLESIDAIDLAFDTFVAALLDGEIDVVGLGMDSGLFTSLQRGGDIRIVASQASGLPNANGAFIVVRKDLMDSGRVREFADLKGMRVAVSALGNSSEYVLAKAMESAGLTLADPKVVVLNVPAMVTALSSTSIDVGMLNEPWATAAEQNGAGVKWKGYADVVPGIEQTVIIFSPEFAARREVATRWMTAYIRGSRDYNDALVKNHHRQMTVDVLAKNLSADPNMFDGVSFAHIDPDGRLNLTAIDEQMRWSIQMGYLTSPVDLARVVDSSFAKAAVATLGPYP